MDYVYHAANWLQASAALLILGTVVVSMLALEGGSAVIDGWRQRNLKICTALAGILLLAGFLMPSLQAVSIEERTAAAFDLKVLEIVLFSTRFGSVWLLQQTMAVLILFALLLRGALMARMAYKSFLLLLAFLTALLLLAGSFKSHAAALEPMWPGLLGNSFHILAAACWLGGLPVLALLLRCSHQQSEQADHALIETTLRRFSVMASMMVGIILLSGIVIGFLQVSRWGELFSTPYGTFLVTKIVLFFVMLSVAAMIRFRYMPQYANQQASASINWAIAAWISLEASVGLLLLGAASVLKGTTPASHEEVIVWPFSFRFSIEATWQESADVRMQVLVGIALIIAAIVVVTYLIRYQHNKRSAMIAGSILLISGLGVALPPLGVEAYPDTYRNSTVPYVAVSIKNGEDLFGNNCTACHGVKGKGDGVLAKTLSAEPANLTEPHTALHTVGDMFWWLTHGMGDDKAMPSFREILDEDDLWDVINYLRAFSEGYTARVIQPYIIANKPFIGAPDFYYSSLVKNGNLKDLRESKSTLLVFFSWPEGRARLDSLKKHYAEMVANDVVIIGVALRGGGLMSDELIQQYPFPLVTEESAAIARTYLQFRRTFQNSGEHDEQPLNHLEFTIDRFGYMRSRWIPQQDPEAWQDMAFLLQQFSALAAEEEILPPPDEHVH